MLSPSSPYVNHLDYYVWGVVGKASNKNPRNTVATPQAAIVPAMPSISKDHLITACQWFRRRIEIVIANDDGFIE